MNNNNCTAFPSSFYNSESSIMSRQTQSKKRKTLRVTFNNMATGRPIISRTDMSPEEKEATWWTKKEYVIIQQRCIKQIMKMDSGIELKDKKYCSRGLEGHTKAGAAAKTKNRREALQSVFKEQEYLKKMQVDPMDWDVCISQVYRLTTSSCQLWATAVGLSDARAVMAANDERLEDDKRHEDNVTLVLGKMFPGRTTSTTAVVGASTTTFQAGDDDSLPQSCCTTARSA